MSWTTCPTKALGWQRVCLPMVRHLWGGIFLYLLLYEMAWHPIEGKQKYCTSHWAMLMQHLQLLVNFDQIGNYILSNGNCTFHDHSGEQVDITDTDKKWAYTLPSQNAPQIQNTCDHGFNFAIVNSKKKSSHYTVINRPLKHPQSLKHSMKSLSVPKVSLQKYLRVLATHIHTKINPNLREI